MKKTLCGIACGAILALAATSAQAGTLLEATDAFSPYLGAVDPGSPANATDEATYINQLLDLAPDPLPDAGFIDIGGRFYNRSDNTCTQPVPCPDATATGATKVDSPGDLTDIDVSNWTYLLAKYGNTSFVWYVGDLTLIDLPSTLSLAAGSPPPPGSGGGISHYSLYNPTTQVPDGGATLGLLGLGMLGLGYLRRRRQQ